MNTQLHCKYHLDLQPTSILDHFTGKNYFTCPTILSLRHGQQGQGQGLTKIKDQSLINKSGINEV